MTARSPRPQNQPTSTHLAALSGLSIALCTCDPAPIDHGRARGQETLSLRPAAEAAQPHRDGPSAAAATHIAWSDKIAWRSGWDAATSEARAQGKSICLVVYAEWCPNCKELAPVFARPEVASAAEDLVMVHHDQDVRASWLSEQLGAYGSYVPRVLFLSPDGRVREDLTSGHPRYPHFYAPMVSDQLVANMRAAKAR